MFAEIEKLDCTSLNWEKDKVANDVCSAVDWLDDI